MGSLERATLCGFICRLCSEMHRVVLHIYGDEGLRLCISEKISRYLSINVSQADPLPKTICSNCLEHLENQHKLMVVMERATNMLKSRRGGQNRHKLMVVMERATNMLKSRQGGRGVVTSVHI